MNPSWHQPQIGQNVRLRNPGEYRLQLGDMLLRDLRSSDLLQGEHGKHQRFILISQISQRHTLKSQLTAIEQVDCTGVAVRIENIVHRNLRRQPQHVQRVHTRRNNSGFALSGYLFSYFIDCRILYAQAKLPVNFWIAIKAPCNTNQVALSSKPFQ